MRVQFPVSAVFLVNAALTLIFIFILLRLRIAAAAPVRRGRMLGDIGEGLRYMVSRADVRLLLAFMFFGGIALRSMRPRPPPPDTSATAVGAVTAGFFPATAPARR